MHLIFFGKHTDPFNANQLDVARVRLLSRAWLLHPPLMAIVQDYDIFASVVIKNTLTIYNEEHVSKMSLP